MTWFMGMAHTQRCLGHSPLVGTSVLGRLQKEGYAGSSHCLMGLLMLERRGLGPYSICCYSIALSCPTLYNPMDYRHEAPLSFTISWSLLKLMSIEFESISDTIQPSHPLSPSPPLTLNLSQHQGLFLWIYSLHQVAKVLEFQLQ